MTNEIIPTLTYIWELLDLIFRKNYNDVILSSTFKILMLSKQNNLRLAIPYWEICDDESDIDFLELDSLITKPYYDFQNKCFIIYGIGLLFQTLHDIQLQLMKLYPKDENHIYKHFIINTINNEVMKRNMKEKTDLSDLLNELKL